MKSGWHHVFVLAMYLMVLAGGWYFYKNHGRAMLERMEYRSDTSGPAVAPGKPKPMSQMIAQSQEYMQDTMKVTTIKIFVVIAFAAISIAMLGHVAMASSHGSMKKVHKYINAVLKNKKSDKYKLKKGDKYYPIFLQIEALAQELTKNRQTLAQTATELNDTATKLEAEGQTAVADMLRQTAARF